MINLTKDGVRSLISAIHSVFVYSRHSNSIKIHTVSLNQQADIGIKSESNAITHNVNNVVPYRIKC